MKTLKLTGAVCLLLIVITQTALSQANQILSNLISPTSINASLIPNNKCGRDLGSNAKRWRNLYLCNRAGINVNPAYPLDIYNTANNIAINVLNPTTGETIDRIGVLSSSIITDNYGYGVQAYGGYFGLYAVGNDGASGGSTHGVYGLATASSCTGYLYGVHGYATGALYNYGVYGEAYACSGGFAAAGYFNGDVYAANYYYISDRKFKTNITAIQSPLEQLMKLKPSAYQFKTGEYPEMGLPKGKQMGLIADEVKQVFPELISQAVKPPMYDKDKKLVSKEVKYESVNYMGLFPVMIAAIQEQQKTIDAVKAENQELKSRLDAIERALNVSSNQSATAISLADAYLGKAVPNPTNRQTVIDYYIPQQTAGKAVMNISNMNGRVVKSISLTALGKGQITLDAAQLTAGTYNYSLIVNGQLVDAKKLVLTK